MSIDTSIGLQKLLGLRRVLSQILKQIKPFGFLVSYVIAILYTTHSVVLRMSQGYKSAVSCVSPLSTSC